MIGGTPKEKTTSDKVIAAGMKMLVDGAILYYLPQAYPQVLCSNVLSGLGILDNPFAEGKTIKSTIAKVGTTIAASYATQTFLAPQMPLLNTVAEEYGNLAYPAAAIGLTAVNHISAGAKSGLTWLFDKKSSAAPSENEMSESQLAEDFDDNLGDDNPVEEAHAIAEAAAPVVPALRRSDRLKSKPRVNYRSQLVLR